jgi:hypothetical protein
MSQFKYLGMTVTNQNLIQEEIKRRLNSGNACYHSVQNLLSSSLLTKNVKVRIYNILREEHKLRVSKNSVLKKIFGPKWVEVTGRWRKLHNEELHNLYPSPSIIIITKSRRLKWTEHVIRMGKKRNVYRLLVGKLEGKRPLGRPRCSWIDNIKISLLEMGLGVGD